MNTQNNLSMQELYLNIKHQNIQVKEFTQVGYEWDEGVFIIMLMIPKKLFPLK